VPCWWDANVPFTFLGKQFGSFSESKTSISEPSIHPKENIWPHKDLYTNVHSSFLCNSPKLETTQMFKNMEMGCHAVRCYSAITRSELLINAVTAGRITAKLKKPDRREYILYDPFYIKL
jgi:hypothetical protein